MFVFGSRTFRLLHSLSNKVRGVSTHTMPLKIAANIQMMFQEIPVLSDRYKAAKECGFRYVESGYPYPEPLETVKKAKQDSGLQQVLINAWPGIDIFLSPMVHF